MSSLNLKFWFTSAKMVVFSRQYIPIGVRQKYSHEARGYSTNNGSDRPNLMNYDVVIWPNIINSVRNWFISKFFVAKYMDRDFSLYEFVQGSKKAVEVVSHHISRGDLKQLNYLVTPDAINELRQNLYQFNLRQQMECALRECDMFLCFPREVGVMFEDENSSNPPKRIVEITMCYHVLPGLREIKEETDIPANIYIVKNRDKIIVANYRFIRDFTEGVKPQWIINALNHIRPTDYQ